MVDVYHIVVKKRKVNVIYRNNDILARGGGQWVIVKHISGFGYDNTRYFLFQDIVNSYLQILVQCQVNIVSCLRFNDIRCLNHFSKVVDINGLRTLFPLKLQFHYLFNTAFSDCIIHGIAFVLSRELSQFFRRNFSCVPENMWKIIRVIIPAYHILLNGNAFKVRGVFHYDGDRFQRDICCHSRGNIFLEAVQVHLVPQCHQFQNFPPGIPFLGDKFTLAAGIFMISAYFKPVNQIVHDFLCRRISHVILKIITVYRSNSVHVRLEA